MHLYLHIPFCHRICPYCSFYKHTPGDTRQGDFIRALLLEAQQFADATTHPPTTLYLGGGTPSMLSPTHLRELFTGLYHLFAPHHFTEVTLEANPATFTSQTAQLYTELGVTRVSLGIQSFTEKELSTLGREHTVAQAIESVELLKNAGPSETNIDLIFSVPGQSLAHWQQTLTQTLALRPQHISAYNLTYEEDTSYFEKFSRGEYQDNEELNAQMFTLAHKELTSAGYEHYETSNYALPGHRSMHNQGYWQGNDYLGLGPSAVSTIQRRRWKNVPDTAAYIHRINTVGHAKEEEEILDDDAFRLERIALMLRTTDGLPLEFLHQENARSIQQLQSQNLITLTSSHLQLSTKGALLVDAIAADLA